MRKNSWEAHLEKMSKSSHYTKTDNTAAFLALAELAKLRARIAELEPDAALAEVEAAVEEQK